MSWDAELTDPVTGDVLRVPPHLMRGGTYAAEIGPDGVWRQLPSDEAALNVTYNYGRHYRRPDVLGGPLTVLDGMTGAGSLPLLERAAAALGDDATGRYWDATEGNAKRALLQLAALARLRPDGVWRVRE